jgi:hypothetical protein
MLALAVVAPAELKPVGAVTPLAVVEKVITTLPMVPVVAAVKRKS